MPSQTHDLVIGRLATHCDVLAEAPQALRIRSAVDAALRERLPAALARAAEPVLDGLDGVVRLRRIDCRLDLRGEIDPGAVAARVTERIVAALRRASGGDAGQARVWPDHDSYLADYIAMRLGIRPQPAWPYEELDALQHLPAGRAAAELIRARPGLLKPLLRLAAQTGEIEHGIITWPEQVQAALVTALADADSSSLERAALGDADLSSLERAALTAALEAMTTEATPGPTPFAGLALLIPSVLALRAIEELGETALAQAAWQALAEEDWDAAATDQALALLYPADPHRIDLAAEQPDPPAHLVADLAEPARALFDRAPQGRRWSALLLADFAGRLRGFEASSPGYLRMQFLRRRGTITREERAVTVQLEPLPLAIVLRMAGHASPPPGLPHLGGRRLVLDLGHGH